METRAHHVLIGAFTLIVMISSALCVLWLGKMRIAREWDSYDIVFTEAVTGLTVGGAVQYNGIQVGEVRKLSLDPSDPRRVIARVRVPSGTPVKTDTKAKLTFTGLTFVAIIQFFGGTPEASMLAAKPGEEVPVIVADESVMQKFMATSEDMMVVAHEVLVRLSQALDRENLDKVAATIDHVERVTGAFASHDEDIGATLQVFRVASQSLRRTLARSEKLMGRLDRLAESSDRVINEDTRKLLEAATRLAENASSVIEQNREALSGFSNQDLAQVGPALTDLRATARALRHLAEEIEDDPQSLLRGKRERPRERRAE
jgi:phospholipid/cholesterol/gamma-HCH transport system substrate-binding protein